MQIWQYFFLFIGAVIQRCSVKKVFLEISQNACSFIKKETLIQVFFCEFCEISKRTYSYRAPPVTASENCVFKTKDKTAYRKRGTQDPKVRFGTQALGWDPRVGP